jgi:phospholipase C
VTAPGTSGNLRAVAAGIEHIVVLMLESRSFDHMLGYLYSEHANVSPRGDAFDGLTGNESCPDENGILVPVFPITSTTDNAYFMPGADPGEGFAATKGAAVRHRGQYLSPDAT